MFKKAIAFSAGFLLCAGLCASSYATSLGGDVTILFTHDIHDYFYTTDMIMDDGSISVHGGAAKLSTLIKENSSYSSVYVDAGDFSMGTLLQSAYASDATELRILGKLGCSYTTFGNHEFDYGADGIIDMLNAALDSGDTLPGITCANLNFSDTTTDEQKKFKSVCADYGVADYFIKDVNGVKVAFFGVMGEESISNAPTSGQVWDNYISEAKSVVQELEGKADLIVALSHSGTNGDHKTGEDVELAKAVPGIDIIISGHSHTTYTEPIVVGNTYIVSQGCYLENLGKLTVNITKGGDVSIKDYTLLRVDDSVADDAEMTAYIDELTKQVDEEYVSKYGYSFSQVIASCPFTFTSLNNMYKTHQEYPMGDLIADAYMYAAKINGIGDIDVALVGLGTIRSTFSEGDITTADAFEACSLGVGNDGSAGHPLIYTYITGKELKLLVELDASLGAFVNSIKMSYSGLNYTFNNQRIILDRVTDVYLVREDGTKENINDKKLYKVCCNKYAANMLGMLNGLTKGILSISLKDKSGNVVTDLTDYSLTAIDGTEIKEWVALCDYLSSFSKGTDGKPEIPQAYADAQGRKVKVSVGGLAIFANPHGTTIAVIVMIVLLIALIIYLILTRKKRAVRRKARKAAK